MALRNPAPVSEALTRHMAQLEAKVSAIEASTLSAGAHADGADHTHERAFCMTMRLSTAAPGRCRTEADVRAKRSCVFANRLQLTRGGMQSSLPVPLEQQHGRHETGDCKLVMARLEVFQLHSLILHWVCAVKASSDTRRLTAASVHPGRSAQVAAREAAAAASRVARDPAALQQLGSALSALQQQVQELAERRGREGETAGGTAQRLDARLMVHCHVASVVRAETCRPRLTGPYPSFLRKDHCRS